MHYKGYGTAVANVQQMGRQQLVSLIEALYGWPSDGGSVEDASLEALRTEAEYQLYQEWTIPTKYHHLYPDAEE